MSEQSRKINHAIIGVGALVYQMHKPAHESAVVEIVAVVDIDREKGEPRAEEIGCPFYTDYRKMLAEIRPEVAVVITPHYNHAQIAIDCLDAECHVLVEKPMALDVIEADEMTAAAERNNRILAVNFQQRHRPEVQAAHAAIHNGALGTIQRVSMVIPWPRSAKYFQHATWRATWKGEGGGVLMNQAPHDLDLLCHLLGRPEKVVSWHATRLHDIEVEDTINAMVTWPGGAVGHIYISTSDGGPKETIDITGTGGRLQIEDGKLYFDQFQQDVYQFLKTTEGFWSGPELGPSNIELKPGSGDHKAVYRDLHAAILEGTPVMADGMQGRLSLELANAMILSSCKQAEVTIPFDKDEYRGLLRELQKNGKDFT